MTKGTKRDMDLQPSLLTLVFLAYYYITWRIWIHRCLDGTEDKFRLSWSSVLSMPDVVAIRDTRNSQDGKKSI